MMKPLIILSVDLSEKKVIRKEISIEEIRKFIGGRGIGAWYLYKSLPRIEDGLDIQNIIYVMAGTFSGYPIPLSGRAQIITKSPLTGAITSSNVGGNFATELQLAGYFGIELKGKLEKPGCLLIYNDTIEFLDCEEIAYFSSHDTDLYLRTHTIENASTMSIGPAGMHLSRIAALMVDGHRAAGRGGVGAVFGSKNLKAIIVKGTKRPEKVLNTEFLEKANEILEKFKSSKSTYRFREFGTTGVLAIINGIGALPYRNFHDGWCPHGEKLTHRQYNKELLIRNGACATCPLGCGRITKAYDKKGHGPEYEIVWALGSSAAIDNLPDIAILNYLANELGYDGISFGTTIAALMDMFEAGIVSREDIGFELRFGDSRNTLKLVELMKLNRGIGKLLNQGSYRLADAFGHPEFSMSVKKQELPAYDPRGIKGMGLAYATNTRGGDHTKAFTVTFEVYTAPYPEYRLEYKDKHKLVKYLQDYQSIVDSTGTCSFGRGVYNAKIYAELFNLLYDADYDENSILKAGERIWNVEKLFNLKQGIDLTADTLPERLFKEPIKNGPSKGEVYDERKFKKLLKAYYELRGWDEKGVPKKQKLEELGIEL